MVDQATPGTESTAGAPPKGDAPKFTPEERLAHHHLASETREAAKIHATHKSAIEAAAGEATKVADADKIKTEGLGALSKSTGETVKAAGEAVEKAYASSKEKLGAAMATVADKLPSSAKALSHFSDNAGKYAAGAALLALAAKMFGKKEVEQPDGTKQEKMGFLAKATVALGTVVALGAAIDKMAPTTKLGGFGKWAGKIAAEKHVQEAIKSMGANAAGPAR